MARAKSTEGLPGPTPEVQGKICKFIRAGATPAAAAEGCGVPSASFWQWMELGDFAAAVVTAEAEARVATEVELRRKNPSAWLGGRSGAQRPVLPPQTSAEKKHHSERELSYRRERFILEYLKDGNAAQASIRAGYSGKGGANAVGARLLANASICERIRAARDRLDHELNLSVERVLREQMRIAFMDPAQLFDADGNLLPINRMPVDARRAITGIEVEEIYDYDRGTKTRVGTLRKVRFANKQPALDSLTKHLGILREPAGSDGERKLALDDLRQLLQMWEERAAARVEKPAEAIETSALEVPASLPLDGAGQRANASEEKGNL
jgi:phage terminase small subunit